MQTLMRDDTFQRIRTIVHEASGISLGDGKRTLVIARLGKRMRELEMGDYDTYLERLEGDSSGYEQERLIDAVSTNVTHFFREPSHFDDVSHILQDLAAQGRSRFRLWSAACSSGEELYSLAMTAHTALAGHDVDLKILGTDICNDVLARASKGVYPRDHVKGIPPEHRFTYLDRVDGQRDVMRITQELRDLVVLRRTNITRTPLPLQGPLDIVLCRNVMIYFGRSTRERLTREMARLIAPGGYLFVGHAESLHGITDKFNLIRPSVYQRNSR